MGRLRRQASPQQQGRFRVAGSRNDLESCHGTPWHPPVTQPGQDQANYCLPGPPGSESRYIPVRTEPLEPPAWGPCH